MSKILKKQVFRNLLSAVLFGVIYLLLSFIVEGYVKIGKILLAMILYFLINSLLYLIAPKLRKITGHDKDNN